MYYLASFPIGWCDICPKIADFICIWRIFNGAGWKLGVSPVS